MLKIVASTRFKRDLKAAIRRGYPVKRLQIVVDMLAAREPLPAQYRDHCLSGELHNFRECHVEPGWLLIYRVKEDMLELFLYRTGTHADLFDL